VGGGGATDYRAQALTLRPFEAGDLDGLADLWVESWTGVMPDIDFSKRRSWLVSRLGDLQARDVAIIVAVAQVGGDLLGFVTVDPISGHLDQLAVARARWGQRVAVALMDAAKACSPGRLELEVNVANSRAARFYEREGFVSRGEGLSAASGLPIQFLRWERPV
jgi:putative acetyltransferase